VVRARTERNRDRPVYRPRKAGPVNGKRAMQMRPLYRRPRLVPKMAPAAPSAHKLGAVGLIKLLPADVR
jgi:hypothetical protein